MTEAEWLTWAGGPTRLLNHVRAGASVRRLRLFACACCRRAWPFLIDAGSRRAVEVVERFADGDGSREGLPGLAIPPVTGLESQMRVKGIARAVDSSDPALARAYWAAVAVRHAAQGALHDAHFDVEESAGHALHCAAECVDGKDQAAVFRDIFGNPFRPTRLGPAQRTRTLVSLAQAAYDERQLPGGELCPHRLAVLADALEEGGAPAELLAHLRAPGPHVRGCHVVDLCLGLS